MRSAPDCGPRPCRASLDAACRSVVFASETAAPAWSDEQESSRHRYRSHRRMRHRESSVRKGAGPARRRAGLAPGGVHGEGLAASQRHASRWTWPRASLAGPSARTGSEGSRAALPAVCHAAVSQPRQWHPACPPAWDPTRDAGGTSMQPTVYGLPWEGPGLPARLPDLEYGGRRHLAGGRPTADGPAPREVRDRIS